MHNYRAENIHKALLARLQTHAWFSKSKVFFVFFINQIYSICKWQSHQYNVTYQLGGLHKYKSHLILVLR